MTTKDLEWVPGDPLKKEFIPVDNSEHARWASTWSDSFALDNVFDDDELDWLEDLMYRQHRSRRVKRNGTLHFNVDNQLIQTKFYTKLKNIIPELSDEVLWEGNFLITATPYNLHIDTGNPATIKDSSSIPGKQFIIPLWVCDKHKEEGLELDCGTAIFKNRFLMYGTNFAKGDAKYDTNVFYTVRNYDNLICYNKDGSVWNVDWNKQTISDSDYKRYFSHYNKQWLQGFELEGVYNWKRGGIIVFDRCQAHSGVNFPESGVTLKCGLSMMSTIKK